MRVAGRIGASLVTDFTREGGRGAVAVLATLLVLRFLPDSGVADSLTTVKRLDTELTAVVDGEMGLSFGFDDFLALRVALLLSLGGAVGARVLATGILSERLCPGTPAKVFAVLGLVTTRLIGVVADVDGRGLIPDVLGAAFWSLLVRRRDARVCLGATTGGAVLATTSLRLRLYPGKAVSGSCWTAVEVRGRRGGSINLTSP